jgi:hypothetical protein
MFDEYDRREREEQKEPTKNVSIFFSHIGKRNDQAGVCFAYLKNEIYRF